MEPNSSGGFRPFSAARVQSRAQRPLPPSARMKERQSSKIRELADAVKAAGFVTLDEQAQALGLSRSTAWTIRKASHKATGLSASIINRMLAALDLPPLARSKILEYIEEKAAGLWRQPQPTPQVRRPAFNPGIAGIPEHHTHSSGTQRDHTRESRGIVDQVTSPHSQRVFTRSLAEADKPPIGW